MDYLDFELEIDHGAGREYPLVVVRSPAGEARETMRFPFDEIELESRLKDLQIALLRSGGKRRLTLSSEQKAVQEFGLALFDALLTGEVRNRYDVSQREASHQGLGLRLKLRIQAPELAALPWEFLYDPREAEYICLCRDTPVVRYLELPRPPTPLTVTAPLRVLGMVASPKGLEPLDVEREKQRIERALAGLQDEGLVELTWLEGQTWRHLQRAMRLGEWHVFHFIGHGGFDSARDEGLVALANDRGEMHRLLATQLGRLLANHRSLRLVVLNSCEGARGGKQDIFSSTASILVRRGIPAVVAMQYEITDRAAIELARSLYESLADGLPVDASLSEARTAISLGVNNTVEWGTPVLYMRAPDGVLFEVQAGEGVPAPRVRRKPAEPVVVPEIETGEPLRPELIRLHRILSRKLDVEEFRTLCFYLSVNYDSLRGEGQAARARELVAYFERRGRVGELVRVGQQMRPDVDWVDAVPVGAGRGAEVAVPVARLPKVLKPGKPFEPEMVLAPAGEFLMGSDPKKDKHADDDEQPQHKLHLPDYYLAKTSVTNAQYLAFVQAAGHEQPKHWEGGKPPKGKEDHPVVYVTWHDAVAYCNWLAEVTGKPYRLPTEAEWEKGARGTDGRIYPWGDEFDKTKCNTGESRIGDTTPVGKYPNGASPYGVVDMAGNVWEWTSSLFRSYPYDPEDGREDPGSTDNRVLRGGSWFSVSDWVRSAFRSHSVPSYWIHR